MENKELEAIIRYIKQYQDSIDAFDFTMKAETFVNVVLHKKKGQYILQSDAHKPRSLLGKFLKFQEDEYQKIEQQAFAQFLIQYFTEWLKSYNVSYSVGTKATTMIQLLENSNRDITILHPLLMEYSIAGTLAISNPTSLDIECHLML